jgi:hypothetical protein
MKGPDTFVHSDKTCSAIYSPLQGQMNRAGASLLQLDSMPGRGLPRRALVGPAKLCVVRGGGVAGRSNHRSRLKTNCRFR